MPKIHMYQIDAFTNEVFKGNPAAVCPLKEWLDDETMLAIAAENSLSETAFFVATDSGYHIRWFTPTQEVVLCGHATLASAYVIFRELDPSLEVVRFSSLGGTLSVTRDGEKLAMEFPAWRLEPCDTPPDTLVRGLGRKPVETWTVESDDNYFAVFDSEDDVAALEPDFNLLARLHPAGVVATAPGKSSDCASRYFAPSYGIPEDPGTGSIHCGLIPYWSHRLGKRDVHARQISRRGAEMWCEDRGDRVIISGCVAKYLDGTIFTGG